MKNAHMPGAPVSETVIDFLRGAVEKYGSRDALLFKPAFRYQRWSYSRLSTRAAISGARGGLW